MSDFRFPQGAASKTVYVVLTDDTDALVTGQTAADVGAHIVQPRDASATAISLSDIAADASYTSGGWAEVDATNTPGLYRLDLPDSALARPKELTMLSVNGSAFVQTYGIIDLDPEPEIVQGQVSGTSATTTSIPTDLASTTTDQYVDAFLLFDEGPNEGAVEKISGYDGAGTLTTDAFPSAPNDTNRFVIVNR